MSPGLPRSSKQLCPQGYLMSPGLPPQGYLSLSIPCSLENTKIPCCLFCRIRAGSQKIRLLPAAKLSLFASVLYQFEKTSRKRQVPYRSAKKTSTFKCSRKLLKTIVLQSIFPVSLCFPRELAQLLHSIHSVRYDLVAICLFVRLVKT